MREAKLAAGKFPVDVALVRRLVAGQFPQWAGLPVVAVEQDGWDNWTFRLGDAMKVRLPSAEGYVQQVEKEARWLPVMAPLLPLKVPVPLAVGRPGEGYPWPWAIYGWIEGVPARRAAIHDPLRFARNVADFIAALQRVDSRGGPMPGRQNFFRGGELGVYDAETRDCLSRLAGRIDTAAALDVWKRALAAEWMGPPVWVHGDVASGNLLLRDGKLAAVIDFGSPAVGDPACDLVLAWTFLEGEARAAFRSAVPADDAMWARARGWALWKAALMLAGGGAINPAENDPRAVIAAVLAEVD